MCSFFNFIKSPLNHHVSNEFSKVPGLLFSFNFYLILIVPEHRVISNFMFNKSNQVVLSVILNEF